MKKFLQNHRIDANVFCIVMYIFFMLFAYDEFCFDTVTTETPLIKLGQLPLLRTEFVALLFSLTALIGAAISMFLRIKGKAYSSILSMVLQGMLFGILMAFYGYNAILLGVFYGFASLIPVVGGTLVWLPVACYELYLGNFTNAII